MQKIILLISLLFSFLSVYAQKESSLKYSDIPVVINIDSLEQNIPKSSTTQTLLKHLLILNKSRVRLGYKKNLALFIQIDSLCKLESKTNAMFVNKLLMVSEEVSEGLNKEKTINDCIKLLEHFKLVNDTSAVVATYYSLIVANLKGIGNFPGSKQLLSKYISECKSFSNQSASIEDRLITLISESTVDYIVFNGINDKLLYDKSIAIISKNKQLSYYLCWVYSRYANSLLQTKNKIQEALNLYILIRDSVNIPFNSSYNASNCYNIGCAYNALNQWQLSKSNVETSLDILYHNFPNHLDLIWNCNKLLAEDLHHLKQYNESWAIKLKADSILQVKLQAERESTFRDLQIKYQTDKKEQENRYLLTTQKLYKIGVAIILLLLSVILLLLLKTKKQNKKLSELIFFRDKIQTIISHDFRSPLFALQGLYEQAKYYIERNDLISLKKISINIDEASNKMGNLLRNLLIWSESLERKKVVANKEMLPQAEIANTIGLYQSIIENQSIVIKNNICRHIVIKGNANVFELLVRNWLDNLLKYAKPQNIEIVASQNTYQTTISIIDDGNIDIKVVTKIQQQISSKFEGLIDETSTGLGLGLMLFFANQEGWKMELKTIENKNEFTITIPLV